MGTITNTAVGTSDVQVDGQLEDNPASLPIANYLRIVPTDLESSMVRIRLFSFVESRQRKQGKRRPLRSESPPRHPRRHRPTYARLSCFRSDCHRVQERDEIDSCLDEPAVWIRSGDPNSGCRSRGSRRLGPGCRPRPGVPRPSWLRNRKGPFADVAAEGIAATPSDVYGFSSLCGSYPLTIRIAKALKSARPETPILLGGPQATVVDQETLAAFPFIDLILRGEAEATCRFCLTNSRGSSSFSECQV